MKVFHLVIYSGATVSRVYVLRKDKIIVGRDPGCDLTLDSMDVSRRHAVLRCSDTEVTIEDMGSTNGTEVNGEKIASSQILKPRDEIMLGKDFRLVFQVVDSVRSGKNDDSESGLRPAYPLPLPQTMVLGKEEFEDQLNQQQFGSEKNNQGRFRPQQFHRHLNIPTGKMITKIEIFNLAACCEIVCQKWYVVEDGQK